MASLALSKAIPIYPVVAVASLLELEQWSSLSLSPEMNLSIASCARLMPDELLPTRPYRYYKSDIKDNTGLTFLAKSNSSSKQILAFLL
jgi:hypothetical protein